MKFKIFKNKSVLLLKRILAASLLVIASLKGAAILRQAQDGVSRWNRLLRRKVAPRSDMRWVRNIREFKSRIKLTDLIEKYRYAIATVLILATVSSLVVILITENKIRPEEEARLQLLEEKVAELEKSAPAKEINVSADDLLNPKAVAPAINQPAASSAASPTKPEVTAPPQGGKININTATLAQLDSLPGIGKTIGQRIIDYRAANGNFASIEAVKKVNGIGDKTYLKFKDLISVGE